MKHIYLLLYVWILHSTIYAQQLFQNRYEISGRTFISAPFVAKGDTDNMIISFNAANPSGYISPVLSKIKSWDGAVVWGKAFFSETANFSQMSLVTNAKGEILISGLTYVNTAPFKSKYFVMKISEHGVFKWAKVFGDLVFGGNNTKAIFLSDGSIAGAYTFDGVPHDVVVFKLDSNAGLIWSKHLHSWDMPRVGIPSEDVFKDMVPLTKGDFVLLVENDNGITKQKKIGLVRIKSDGSFYQHVNIRSADVKDIFSSSVSGGEHNNLTIACRSGSDVKLVAVGLNDQIVWQSDPIYMGLLTEDYQVKFDEESRYTYLYGMHDMGDEGLISLRVLRYDSSHLTNNIHMPSHFEVKNIWMADPLIDKGTVYLPFSRRSAGDNDESFYLTKLKNNLEGCKPFPSIPYTSQFPGLVVENYNMQLLDNTLNAEHYNVLLEQNEVAIDTTVEFSCNFVPCISGLKLPSDQKVCFDSTFIIDFPEQVFYRYLWSTGDTTHKIKVTQTGNYALTLFPKDTLPCDTLSDTINVSFIRTPSPDISVSSVSLWPGEPTELEVLNPVYDSVLWNVSAGGYLKTNKVSYSFNRGGNYHIYFKGYLSGCLVSDTIDVLVSGESFYLPDAFTPDADGLNDVFVPKGSGILHYEMNIYNRWGQLVFHGRDKGWNGEFVENPAPSGLYVYLINYQTESGAEKQHKGTITLMR